MKRQILIETKNCVYSINKEIDMGTLAKSVLDDNVETFCSNLKDSDGQGKIYTYSLNQIDRDKPNENTIFMYKNNNIWFVSENDGKQTTNQAFIDFIVKEWDVDLTLLGDKRYEKISNQFSKEELDRYLLLSQLLEQLSANMEYTDELSDMQTAEHNQTENLNMQNDDVLSPTTDTKIPDIDDSNVNQNVSKQQIGERKNRKLFGDNAKKIDPEKYIQYINSNEYRFPQELNTHKDNMKALKNRLMNENLDVLVKMLERLKSKNNKLREIINASDKEFTNISEKIEDKIKENETLTNELNKSSNMKSQDSKENNDEVKEAKVEEKNTFQQTQYDPNDSSAMEMFRQQSAELAKQEAKKQEEKELHKKSNVNNIRKQQ